MEPTHGDKLLNEVNGHIEECGRIGMAALADGQHFIAGQAFTALHLAERVRDTLQGHHTRPLVQTAPAAPPEKKPRAPRKPKAEKQTTLAGGSLATTSRSHEAMATPTANGEAE